MTRLLAAILILLALPVPVSAAPSRIVSINLCTDVLLLELADRQQIASLSFLAADPTLSVVTERIVGIPINYGRVEEVRMLDPDLVLAGDFGAQFAVSILKQHGYRVVQIPAVLTLAEIAPAIEAIGEAIGQSGRAKVLAASVRERLVKLSATAPAQHPTAVVFQQRGYAAGRPSLADDVLTLAGGTNRAADTGFGDWVPLGVEGLLNLNPDVVVFDQSGNAPPALSEGVFTHRALKAFAAPGRMVRVPTKLWSCGVPETLDAVVLLRQAFAAVETGHVR